RTMAPFFSWSRRMASRLMMVRACLLPWALVPAATRARAAFFWSAVISSNGKPLRVGLRFASCRGTKYQSVRSLLSKSKAALVFCSGARAARNFRGGGSFFGAGRLRLLGKISQPRHACQQHQRHQDSRQFHGVVSLGYPAGSKTRLRACNLFYGIVISRI